MNVPFSAYLFYLDVAYREFLFINFSTIIIKKDRFEPASDNYSPFQTAYVNKFYLISNKIFAHFPQ